MLINGSPLNPILLKLKKKKKPAREATGWVEQAGGEGSHGENVTQGHRGFGQHW